MTTEAKILGLIGIFTTLIVVFGIIFLNKPVSSDLASTPQTDQKILLKQDSQQTGPKNANVTVVEFGDYQCPACGAAYPTLKRLKEEYKGKVNFVFRNYPLPQHKNALTAAHAAEAAGAQGKFWQMHDKMYEEQNEWSESDKALEIFAGYAKEMDLNVERFKKEVQEQKYKNRIMQDEKDGGTAAIRYTPTYFVNGHKLEGAVSYDIFKAGIESVINPR